jgi:hypothetical protein
MTPGAIFAQVVFSPTTGTPQSWATPGNWVGGNLPTSAQDAQLGANTVTMTVNLDGAQSINRLIITTATTATNTPVTIAAGTGGSLTIGAGGILHQSGSQNTISAPVTLGASQTWDIGQSTSATPAGSEFTGMIVSGVISDGGNNYGITKTGFRSLTLSGANTFGGGVTHTRGSIFLNNAQGLGTGTFVFQYGGTGTAATLSYNANNSPTIANNIQLNSATSAATISTGSVPINRVLSYTGNFTLGSSWNGARLDITSAGTTNGASQNTTVLSGDWSGYTKDGGPTPVIRFGTGAVRIDSALSLAPGANYEIGTSGGNFAAPKVLFNGDYNVANNFSLVDSATATGNLRPTIGTLTAAATTTNYSGTTALGTPNMTAARSVDGLNIVAQNADAIFNVSGDITGAANTNGVSRGLRINEGYTYTSADGVSGLQTPVGTVVFSRAGGISATGAVEVSGGVFRVTNTSGSATGTGAVAVGTSAAAVGGVAGTNGAVGSRIITGLDTATVSNLRIGQAISGTGIPVGSVVVGILIGNGTNNSGITISQNITTTGAATLAFDSFSRSATLEGTGIIAGPTTVLAGSFLAPGLGGDTRGLLSFGSSLTLQGTTTFNFAGGNVRGTDFDAINVTGALNNGGALVFDFSSTIGEGTYNLFSFGSTAGSFSSVSLTGVYGAVALTPGGDVWTGVGSGGKSFTYDQLSGNLTVIPEPSAFAAFAGLIGLGFAATRRRKHT